jgi:hypothetical protein
LDELLALWQLLFRGSQLLQLSRLTLLKLVSRLLTLKDWDDLELIRGVLTGIDTFP